MWIVVLPVAAVLAGYLTGGSSARTPGPSFAPPVYVDQQLAGGEPEVFADMTKRADSVVADTYLDLAVVDRVGNVDGAGVRRLGWCQRPASLRAASHQTQVPGATV